MPWGRSVMDRMANPSCATFVAMTDLRMNMLPRLYFTCWSVQIVATWNFSRSNQSALVHDPKSVSIDADGPSRHCSHQAKSSRR